MSFKVKIRLLIILAVAMAASLICGCSIGLPGYDKLQKEYDITSIVTYYANGGNFSTAAVISRELDFSTNQLFYNITESTTVSVKRTNYTFNEWCYVKSEYFTETDEEGNETEVLYFYLDVTDADMSAYPDDEEGGKYFIYSTSYSDEDNDNTYSIQYDAIHFKNVDNEWLISQEDYDYFVRLKKNYSNDASLSVPLLKTADAVDTTMILEDDVHLYVVATWNRAQSVNFNLVLKSFDTLGDLTANVTGAISDEEASDNVINAVGNTFTYEGGDSYTYSVADSGKYLFTISSGDVDITVERYTVLDGEHEVYIADDPVNLYISNDSSSENETSKEIEVAAGDRIVVSANALSSLTYEMEGSEETKPLSTGALLYRQYFGSQTQVGMPADFNRVSGVSVEDYTLIGYYLDEDCTMPAGNVDKPDEGDVQVYVLYVENASGMDWTVVETATNVVSMFRSPSANFYIKNDIDCSSTTVSPYNAFMGRIEGNGHTLSGLTVSPSTLTENTAVAMFGIIYEGAAIHDLTFENLTVSYTAKASINTIHTYLICSDIADDPEKVDISGLTIDGVSMTVVLPSASTMILNITRENENGERYYVATHWIYGNGSDDAGNKTDDDFDLDVTILNKSLIVIADGKTIEVYSSADSN